MNFFLNGKFLAVILLDVVLGDPRWLPHPVRVMGDVIVYCEERLFQFGQRPMIKRLARVDLALGGLPLAMA